MSQPGPTPGHRPLDGTGDYDVPPSINAVRQVGWSGIGGIERMPHAHHRLPVGVGPRPAGHAARACLDPAEGRRR